MPPSCSKTPLQLIPFYANKAAMKTKQPRANTAPGDRLDRLAAAPWKPEIEGLMVGLDTVAFGADVAGCVELVTLVRCLVEVVVFNATVLLLAVGTIGDVVIGKPVVALLKAQEPLGGGLVTVTVLVLVEVMVVVTVLVIDVDTVVPVVVAVVDECEVVVEATLSPTFLSVVLL